MTRIPLKAGLDLLDPLYKDPLFDALCDPNPYSRNIGMEILRSLILNHAKKILPAVEDALKSPNYDKVYNSRKCSSAVWRTNLFRYCPLPHYSICFNKMNTICADWPFK